MPDFVLQVPDEGVPARVVCAVKVDLLEHAITHEGPVVDGVEPRALEDLLPDEVVSRGALRRSRAQQVHRVEPHLLELQTELLLLRAPPEVLEVVLLLARSRARRSPLGEL